MASLSLASVAWQKKNDKGLGRRNGLQILDDVNHKHCLSLPGVCSHPQELGRLTMFPVCKGRLVQNPCRRFRQQSTIATLNALHIMLRISNAQVLQTLFVLIFSWRSFCNAACFSRPWWRPWKMSCRVLVSSSWKSRI